MKHENTLLSAWLLIVFEEFTAPPVMADWWEHEGHTFYRR